MADKESQIREKNEQVSHRIDFGPYGFIQFQKGPRNEVGRNGMFIADDEEPAVLSALIEHLKGLATVLPSRETSLAITKLEEANLWLLQRKFNRRTQGVLGTYKEHK